MASERLVGVPYPGIQDMITARGLAYGGRTYVETNGPGDPVLENLGIRATGFVTTARSKVDAITALQMLVERGMLKADIPQLDRELRVYRWDDRDLVQDGVMALAIAAYHLPRRWDTTERIRAESASPSHAGGIDYDQTRPETSQPVEVTPIERQQVRHGVHVAHGHQAGVMDLLADHACRTHQGPPCRVDVRCVGKQWES